MAAFPGRRRVPAASSCFASLPLTPSLLLLCSASYMYYLCSASQSHIISALALFCTASNNTSALSHLTLPLPFISPLLCFGFLLLLSLSPLCSCHPAAILPLPCYVLPYMYVLLNSICYYHHWYFIPSQAQNVVFNVRKKMSKLPELGGGGSS